MPRPSGKPRARSLLPLQEFGRTITGTENSCNFLIRKSRADDHSLISSFPRHYFYVPFSLLMRLLADTHALLWFLQGDRRLSKVAARAIESAENTVYVSAASVWEMAIKSSLGKLKVPYSLDTDLPRILRENNFTPLPVTLEHAAGVQGLPFHHRDPFDRLLIAQGRMERLDIISSDPVFKVYGLPVVW